MLAGRTPEQKREIARQLTEAMVNAAGAKPEAITVIMHDVDPGSYAAGGILYSDKGK